MCGTPPFKGCYPQQGQQQAINPYNPPLVDKSKIARYAADELTSLMSQQLGFAPGHIDPIALRLFIRAYWTRVSTLAHRIHDE